MKNLKTKQTKKHWSYYLFTWLALAIGILTCCFSRFTFNMFFCAFIFPFCFLFFNRRVKWYIGLPLTLVGLFGGCCVAFYKMFSDNPATGIFWAMLIDLLAALVIFIPYALDKLVYQRFFETKRPILYSFMFPLTWLTIDFILGLTLAGTYLSLGYALCQILQTVSVIGLFGIHFLTFIIVYFGSALTSFVSNIHTNWKQLVISASMLGFSGAYAGIYQAVPMTSSTIKIATSEFFGNNTPITDCKNRIQEDIGISISNNVNVLVYSEMCFNPSRDDYTNLQAFVKEQTSGKNLLLLLPVYNKGYGADQKWYNETWYVRNGEIEKIYKKQRPFFPVEVAEPGDGVVSVDIKLNDGQNCRVGSVTCYDLEFPEVIAQAGRLGVDVLFAPSWDNTSFGEYRSDVNAFRALESGCNFVKVTECGWSLACDYKGRVYEHYLNADGSRKTNLHIFDMPAKRGFAIYPWLNLFIDYFYPIGLAGVITTSGILNLKDKKRKPSK